MKSCFCYGFSPRTFGTDLDAARRVASSMGLEIDTPMSNDDDLLYVCVPGPENLRAARFFQALRPDDQPLTTEDEAKAYLRRLDYDR